MDYSTPEPSFFLILLRLVADKITVFRFKVGRHVLQGSFVQGDVFALLPSLDALRAASA